MRVHVIEDPGALRAWTPQWDALAVRLRQPFSAPAWALSWWQEAAPPGAKLRVVVAADAQELVGIVPLVAEPFTGSLNRYRFLGSTASLRTAPLCVPGRRSELAAATARVLAVMAPRVDAIAIDGIPADSGWVRELCDAWPRRRCGEVFDISMPAPVVTLDGTYESWFSERSKNFREQMRRRRRQLDSAGAVFRLADRGSLERDLASFIELHHSRWEGRGGSGVLTPQVERMLARAGPDLLDESRFRLWSLDAEGRTISSHIFLAAGGELSYWLGGFDPEWATFQPAMQVLLAAVEHAFAVGDRRLDLGGGGQSYKYRLADSEEELIWTTIVPRGGRHVRARIALAPRQIRRGAMRRIPPAAKDKVKRALGRPV